MASTKSTTLNLNNYRTVWSDNFQANPTVNSSIFTEKWGNSDDFSKSHGGLTLTSYAREGWAAAGFLQPDFGATSSQGYGLYSATFEMQSGQGNGPCICMWPSTNAWPGPEIDLAEDWSDPTRQTGYATIHWAGAGGSNDYQSYQFHANMTQPTTVAMDWERGSLTFYVNNQEVFQYTGPEVPTDAADGGTNEAFGAEVTDAGASPVSSSVSLTMLTMSYSALKTTTTKQGSNTTTDTALVSPSAVNTSTTPTLVGPNTGTPADQPAISPAQGNVTFSFETVAGQQVINNWQSSDTLDLAGPLLSSLHESQTGGGVLLTFGNASSGSILLAGVTNLPSSQVHAI